MFYDTAWPGYTGSIPFLNSGYRPTWSSVMQIFPPGHATFKESQLLATVWREGIDSMDVSDEQLREYVKIFFIKYRSALERFFPAVAPLIPFYAQYPYKTTVVRLGPNGVMIGHVPNQTSEIVVMKVDEFDPPLESLNIREIAQRLQTSVGFDTTVREYNHVEAEIDAVRSALNAALEYYWQTIDEIQFTQLCQELLRAEKIDLDIEATAEDSDQRFDAIGEVLISEPAGFRRVEKWFFDFKHYRSDRVSARYLREIENYLNTIETSADVLCLITSGDLTSIGSNIAINSQRVRVWDRSILHKLVNNHLLLLEPYFAEYTAAAPKLFQELNQSPPSHSRLKEFEAKLTDCPTGLENFARYENIGIEIWQYLFEGALGKPQPQRKTADGTQRRDVLFRNNRTTKFFQRIAGRFAADFVIVDFKNYKEPITPDVIDDVAKYPNKALGRFVVVVSRLGSDDRAWSHQMRLFSVDDKAIIAIKDSQMLEMIGRKEAGETPEDLLEDILDELLIQY